MMTLEEIKDNVGNLVTINGARDLAFESEFKPFIYDQTKRLTIVKLTKGGMVHLKYGKRFYTVPPRNVDLVEENEIYYPADIINLVQEDVKRKTGKYPAIHQLKITDLDVNTKIEIKWNQK